MAAIKIAYIGGGSTRAPGALASFVARADALAGSEICLIDLGIERLELVRGLAQRMAAARGVDLRVTATTDRRGGLTDADAVLTSFRPGGFEARALDERIPLSHGVIGQETQGPGGLFMAFRSIHVLRGILADIELACPKARIFNYTNPVNIVSQAISARTSVPVVSLCEGPILYPAGSPSRLAWIPICWMSSAWGSIMPRGAWCIATTVATRSARSERRFSRQAGTEISRWRQGAC